MVKPSRIAELTHNRARAGDGSACEGVGVRRQTGDGQRQPDGVGDDGKYGDGRDQEGGYAVRNALHGRFVALRISNHACHRAHKLHGVGCRGWA